MTTQQMRALADRADEAGAYEVMETGIVDELATNLRAAADQLEAVRAWVDEHYHHFPEISDLDALLNGADR